MRKLSLILLIWVLFSCGKGEGQKKQSFQEVDYSQKSVISLPQYEGKKPETGGVFRRSIPSDPVTLNPVVASDMTSYLVYKWIFDPLFDMDKDMNLIPVLVDSYKFSEDNLKLTLNLKKNILWHDGNKLTGEDVIFTFDAINDKSVEAINKRYAFENIKSYKLVDDYTIDIELKGVSASILYDLVIYIIPKHIYNYPFGKGDKFNKHPNNTNPIGSGPFKFVSWSRGETIILKANERYFNGRPNLEELVFKVMSLNETEYSAFMTGSLDITRLTPELWEKCISDENFRKNAYLLEYPSRQYFYIGWNMDGSNPFFTDKRVRKAMTYAINREAFINVILKKHATYCLGPFYPDSDYSSEDVKPLPYDPELASKLLDEAQFKDSNGNGIRDKNGVEFEFECIYPQQSRDYERFLEFFAADLKRVGVSMKLRAVEWAIFLKRTNSHKFEAFLSGYSYGDDPNPFLMYHSSMAEILPTGEAKGGNDVSYKNLEVDKLIEEQSKEIDPQKRKEILKKIHKIIYEDQPYTYLVVPYNLVALKNKFQNVELSRKGYGLFTFYPALIRWWLPKELREK